MASLAVKLVYLENFQSHHRSKLTLAPAGHLTVITGPSDSGKTAILRALRLLAYNTPQGTDYIRVGQNGAAVAVHLADGTIITRERTRGTVNRYRVVEASGAEQVYEGFGTDVPVRVQELIGIRPVNVGDLDLNLNLAEQLDGPFLGKTISAGARAKVLGKLAGTAAVDQAAKALGTDLYRAGQEEKRLVAEVEALKQSIASYAYLATLAERIRALETRLARIRECQERRQRVVDLRAHLLEVSARRAEAELVTDRWRALGAAESLAGRLEAAALRSAGLLTLRRRQQQVEDGRRHAQSVVGRWAQLGPAQAKVERAGRAVAHGQALLRLRARYRQVTASCVVAKSDCRRWDGLGDAEKRFTATQASADHQARLTSLALKLRQVRHDQILAEDRRAQVTGMIADAERQYTETVLRAGRCPLCGSTVNPVKLREVV